MTRFLKGHGTGNDFILLPDWSDLDPEQDSPTLSSAQVQRLCDRRTGIGADGVLRVLPVGAATRAEGLDTGTAQWFMDYRNADGSVSEMCGNGARLFARFLLESGSQSGTEFQLATRGGVRQVRLAEDGSVRVDMGPARAGLESTAQIGSYTFAGRQISMTNPHLVCVTTVPVEDIDLSLPPGVDDTLFPYGANVEFVNCIEESDTAEGAIAQPRMDGADVLRVRMRVHERGVGETRSCGTGACAVASEALNRAGRERGEVLVDVPGGQLRVSVTPETTVLGGPAVFVASGEIDPDWWASTASPASAV